MHQSTPHGTDPAGSPETARERWAASLFAGLAIILGAEILLYIDVAARGGIVVPAAPLPAPSGVIEHLARWTATWRRSPEVRFHMLKNRWLTLLRNDTRRAWLRHLPWILARDATQLGITAIRSPSVLLRLWRARSIFRRVSGEPPPCR